MSVEAVGTTRRGRGARKAARQAHDFTMLPALKRGIPLTEPMSEEQIERIDAASMDILENVGVVFRDEIAIADWKRAGADIRDGDRVHLDRGLVRELIASIPETFTYHARDPKKSLPFGRDHAIFVPMTGAPICAIWTICAATRRSTIWPISTSLATCCPRSIPRRITS